MGTGMGIGPAHLIPVSSIPAPYPPPHKTWIRLFEILICCLYLDILLIVMSYMVFKAVVKHLVNYQVLIYCFD